MDYYSFNRPRRDGWLSWPCWLTDSGCFTHNVVTRPTVSLAQDRESSPARTGGLITMLRHQFYMIFVQKYFFWNFLSGGANVDPWIYVYMHHIVFNIFLSSQTISEFSHLSSYPLNLFSPSFSRSTFPKLPVYFYLPPLMSMSLQHTVPHSNQ